MPRDPIYSKIQDFISGLCWQTEIPGKRRSGFPSWSWAGWTGTVFPRSREYIVSVKTASWSDVKISVFWEGRVTSWEDMWPSVNGSSDVRQDLPHYIYIEAWTSDLTLKQIGQSLQKIDKE